jgi:hypothetical protein
VQAELMRECESPKIVEAVPELCFHISHILGMLHYRAARVNARPGSTRVFAHQIYHQT